MTGWTDSLPSAALDTLGWKMDLLSAGRACGYLLGGIALRWNHGGKIIKWKLATILDGDDIHINVWQMILLPPSSKRCLDEGQGLSAPSTTRSFIKQRCLVSISLERWFAYNWLSPCPFWTWINSMANTISTSSCIPMIYIRSTTQFILESPCSRLFTPSMHASSNIYLWAHFLPALHASYIICLSSFSAAWSRAFSRAPHTQLDILEGKFSQPKVWVSPYICEYLAIQFWWCARPG